MNYYKNERCIIFDESGNLGSNGRYFVIACIDTTNFKSLHNIMKRKILDAKKVFPELANIHANEIKANEAYPAIKHHILECVISKDIKISYIVADLNYTKPYLLKDKNIFYNFLMKLLLDSIISKKDNGTKINILCDNKTTKVASANSFSDYIKIHFIYEKSYEIELNIEYFDSDANNAYSIQAADYIANAIYSKYEFDANLYCDVINSKIENCLKFPIKNFGK